MNLTKAITAALSHISDLTVEPLFNWSEKPDNIWQIISSNKCWYENYTQVKDC